MTDAVTHSASTTFMLVHRYINIAVYAFSQPPLPLFPTGRGVRGHFAGKRPWAYVEELTRDQMARMVGATREEVVLMNALTVNLHLGLVSTGAALARGGGTGLL